MEVGKRKCQILPTSSDYNDFEDDDDDDVRFVIALDESGLEDDELDGGIQDPTENGDPLHTLSKSKGYTGSESGKFSDKDFSPSFTSGESDNIVNNANESGLSQKIASESQSLSLRLDCTTDEDDHKVLKYNPAVEVTENNGSSQDILSVPNFLVSSPEVIKRLRSHINHQSASSDKEPNIVSSSFEGQLQEKSTVDKCSVFAKKNSETQRKLHFSPRADCDCIMCDGWDPSKISTSSSGNPPSSSQLHQRSNRIQLSSSYPVISSQSTLPIENRASELNVSNSNASVASFANQEQLSTPKSGLNLISTSSNCEKLNVNPHSNHQSSLTGSMKNTVSLSNTDQALLPKSVHPVLKQNGSYFMLFPLPDRSKQNSVALLKKMIPEIDTKDGKVLVLTHAYVSLYQPDLRPLLVRAKKLDLSVPGTVCILMSNKEPSSLGTDCISKNSEAPFQVHSSQNISSSSSNLVSNVHQHSSNLYNNGGCEALLKVIYSHLEKNDITSAASLSKILNSSQKGKHPPSSKYSDAFWTTQSVSLSSSCKVTLPNPVYVVSKVTNGSKPPAMSSLPPPPPLVRCPGIYVEPQKKLTSVSLIGYPNPTVAPISECTTNIVPAKSCSNSSITSTPFLPPLPHNCADMIPTVSQNTNVTVPDLLPISHTTPLSTSVASSVDKPYDIQEPREILVIPVVNKEKSTDQQCLNASLNRTREVLDSASSHTFTALCEMSPVKSPVHSQDQSQEENTVVTSQQRLLQYNLPTSHSSVTSKSSPATDQSKQFSNFLSITSKTSKSLANTTSELSDPKIEILNNQSASLESTFPSVVKLNLSSCANIVCPFTVTPNYNGIEALSTISSSSVLTTTTNCIKVSNNSDSYHGRTFSLQKSALPPALRTESKNIHNSPPQSFQVPSLTFNYSSPSTAPSLHTLSPQVSSSRCYDSLPTSTQSIFTKDKSITSKTVLSSSSSMTDFAHATTSCLYNVPVNSKTINTSYPSKFSPSHHEGASVSFSSSLKPLSSATTLPVLSSEVCSSSSSSVSVNGLKLKIRLGDTKTNSESEGGEYSNNSAAFTLKTKSICDQEESSAENLSVKRKESAEEMFQRFQEQAMREVYNAQFGVGNLSRSLRPARSNISFVDKSMWRNTEGKKKKNEDSSNKNNLVEEIKRNGSTNESLLKVPDNDGKSLIKVNKKRHSSSEGRIEDSTKEPEYDINDFPKLKEDNSILIKKTIYTPNIMAGHKVFVKFNVFSNPQSGRNFLIPFFNLGGSRVQFDNEDMEYIKKAVVEVEKEEKFCARHLIYYSREGNKASFLRKENLAQMNELNDKSYKQCSYILEGFSRELSKKNVPLPDEWKVDKKVSIEIDTADVDSNVVIDFEDSLADAVVAKGKGSIGTHTKSEKSNVDLENDSLNHMSSSVLKTQVINDFCDDSASTSQQQAGFKMGTKSFPQNPVNYVSSSKTQSPSASCQMDGNTSSYNAKVSNYRPNILRKTMPMSKSNFCSNLTHTTSTFSSNIVRENSSSGSLVNYTDQLKELFSSGNLLNNLPQLEEDNHNQVKEVPEHCLENSKTFPFVPIKEEIIDKEYEASVLQSHENLSFSNIGESSALASTNQMIKSEPPDEYFNTMQTTPTRTSILKADNQVSNTICPETDQSVLNAQSKETDIETHEKDMNCEIMQQTRPDLMKWERDSEETLSNCSETLALSSAVSESSNISSSSYIDTSDEDIYDDYDENEPPLSSCTLSYSGNISHSPGLLNENITQNPINTKITSLVESLKQRLIENKSARLPTVFGETAKQPVKKFKKKKKRKSRKMLPLHIAPNNSYIEESKISPLTRTDVSETQEVCAVFDQNINTVNSQAKCSISASENSSQITRSSEIPSTVSNPTSFKDVSNFDESSISSKTVIPTTSSETCDTEICGNVLDFKKRYPFITSGNKVNFPKVSNKSDTMQGSLSDMVSCNMSDIQKQESVPSDTKIHSSSNDPNEGNEFSRSTPHSDLEIDSESDIDVGSENMTLDNSVLSISEATLSLSSPPLPTNGRNHLRDFTRENGFIISKENKDTEHYPLSSTDNYSSPQKFVLPIRPRTRTKTVKKSPKSNITNPPSAASLLCQKLDISIEPMKPKLKGKLMTSFQVDTSVEIENNPSDPTATSSLPKPINPGFKPSLNAIFGVADIPKSLDPVINKPSSSKISVAKKSSSKNNPNQVCRQVARKGTLMKFKDTKVLKQRKANVNENKTLQNESVYLSDYKKSVTKKQTSKKGTLETLKVTNIAKLQKGDCTFENKALLESEAEIQSVHQKEGTMGKSKVTNKTKLQKRENILKKKSPSETKLIQKKLKGKNKPVDTNRKLGSLLIEVNRYSSLRKFAWRKYSSLKEKTYFVETGEKDLIPEIIATNFFDEVNQDIGNTNNNCTKEKGKESLENEFGIKPCQIKLHKLEAIERDSKEFLRKESGTYVINQSQEDEKDERRVSDIVRKRKKKSVITRHKKGSGKQRRVKKDIVDYYAAAIESLRKKALLLEEDNKKNEVQLEQTSQPTIKQEVMELDDLIETEETINTVTPIDELTGKEVSFQQVSNMGEFSSPGCNEIKSDKMYSQVNNFNQESGNIISIDDGTDIAEVEKSLIIDTECNVSNNGPPVIPEKDHKTDISIPIETFDMKICDEMHNSPSLSKAENDEEIGNRKCVKMVERNYEGDMIQVLYNGFQDQSDVKEMSEDEDDIDLTYGLDNTEGERQEIVEAQESGIDSSYASGENHSERNRNKLDQTIGKDDREIVTVKLDQEIGKSGRERITVDGTLESEVKDNAKLISHEDFIQIDMPTGDDVIEEERKDRGVCLDKKENNSNVLRFIPQQCTGTINALKCDESTSKSKLERKSSINEDVQVSKSTVMNDDATLMSEKCEVIVNDCDRNILTATESTSDRDFIHKDIVLGFEDALGADTVLSKLAAEGEDDMFFLGDGEDDVENIGLIPDEEVERLLGLDIKDGEDDLSAFKANEDQTKEGSTNPNTCKLNWRMLPESVIKCNNLKGKDPEKLETKECDSESQKKKILTIGPCSKEYGTDVSFNKSAQTKSFTEISPSWKRILGTQALKEIEESVSSTIATSDKESCNHQESGRKTNIGFKADKLNLKLCTGALSKALKLSAEMRKTFGDTANEPNCVSKRVEEEETKIKIVPKSHEKRNTGQKDGGSFFNIANSVAPSSSLIDPDDKSVPTDLSQTSFDLKDNLSHVNVDCVNNDETFGINVQTHENDTSKSVQSGQLIKDRIPQNQKPLVMKKIDLTKLKMKLTPILASKKSISAITEVQSVGKDNKSNIPSSVPVPNIEIKEQRTAIREIMSMEQRSIPNATNVKKNKTPLLNTEKLTNILKNFKKPPNMNLPSSSSKTAQDSSCNVSRPSQKDKITSDQTQNRLDLNCRKRTRLSQDANPDTTADKRPKRSVVDKHDDMAIDESEDDKGERSCFDCLSELTPK